MKDVGEVHFRVIDKGLFLPVARRLARDAALVTYWTPHERAFRTVRDTVGDGFPEISRVQSPWQDSEAVDCWVFPDIGFADLQGELLRQGKIVWGCRRGCRLEMSRGYFLQTLANETELPVPKYTRIVGMAKLREHLKDKTDKWLKTSDFRGDFETFHWRSWEEDENELDRIAVRLGPWRDVFTFYVFEPIEADVEDGCDSWCIDGKFPQTVIHGMEAKDVGFLGTFQKFSDLPKEVRIVNEQIAPVLEQFGYRGFFSTEVRITKEGSSLFTDPTCRSGSPPSQAMTEMISNYGEIIWGGANGNVVEPEPAALFGVQSPIQFKGDRADFISMKLVDGLDQWVKCGFANLFNGVIQFNPDPEHVLGDPGWLVGIGDTIEKAIEHLKTNAGLLPDGASCNLTGIADLLKQVHEVEEKGMEFTDQKVPEPAIVVEES